MLRFTHLQLVRPLDDGEVSDLVLIILQVLRAPLLQEGAGLLREAPLHQADEAVHKDL